MIGSARDDRQFRRGVVLGLTMAEALLLLIFLLMLTLGVKLKSDQTHIADLEKQKTEAQSSLAALQPILAKLSKVQKFDITHDYQRVQQQLDLADAKLKDAQLTVDLVQQAAAALPNAKPEDAAKALIQQAVIGQQAITAAQKLAPNLPPDQAVAKLIEDAEIGAALRDKSTAPKDLLASAAACRSDLQSCKNQSVFLSNRLNAKAGGFGLPPCWVDRTGKIQYIFDTALKDDGIEVDDDSVEGREDDQAKLPLDNVPLNSTLTRGEFAHDFQPLLDWSNQHGCRFFVRLYDDMQTADRDDYKAMRGTVEGYFRILLSQ